MLMMFLPRSETSLAVNSQVSSLKNEYITVPFVIPLAKGCGYAALVDVTEKVLLNM